MSTHGRTVHGQSACPSWRSGLPVTSRSCGRLARVARHVCPQMRPCMASQPARPGAAACGLPRGHKMHRRSASQAHPPRVAASPPRLKPHKASQPARPGAAACRRGHARLSVLGQSDHTSSVVANLSVGNRARLVSLPVPAQQPAGCPARPCDPSCTRICLCPLCHSDYPLCFEALHAAGSHLGPGRFFHHGGPSDKGIYD